MRYETTPKGRVLRIFMRANLCCWCVCGPGQRPARSTHTSIGQFVCYGGRCSSCRSKARESIYAGRAQRVTVSSWPWGRLERRRAVCYCSIGELVVLANPCDWKLAKGESGLVDRLWLPSLFLPVRSGVAPSVCAAGQAGFLYFFDASRRVMLPAPTRWNYDLGFWCDTA